MQNRKYRYLLKIQFLGFRYSGWQNQPGQRTVEGMLYKTLKFIMPGKKIKILGAGRTDAKVSALDAAFELFLEEEPIGDFEKFIEAFNLNLPPDIKALEVTEVVGEFNIIQHPKFKEYVYLFSYGEKNHPFSAPFMAHIPGPLDIGLMKSACTLFVGTHDFAVYTARAQKNTKTRRTISGCEIKENAILTANFFPKKSYMLTVRGEGFMRYQVRMMMGALIQLGRGELTVADLENSLIDASALRLTYVAPGSGLMLKRLEF
ncbi:tRNA pseudouridine(38-40) synthase TruA [Flavobacteriaceae bacterium F89]|uniref:tRNA pseudouridine synthase A n=1 Tax=Cerina litoralis TaxID=2874477 RepID=A0AAE3JPU0_9FLAO|nr:tRNA pseudouridine(38-40) synthase TruA [Cerina litoralis]MCG2461401.1 tRNA pseudouridine(38-40) synthase TruA [Cerina litoralis]